MGYKDFNLPSGKSPPPPGWQRLAGNVELAGGWRGRSTENFVVVDLDGSETNPLSELIERYERKFRDRITTVVETPSGGKHYWHSGTLRNQQNDGWDIRGEGGYVCVPPSPGYRFVTPELPLEYLRPFPPELLKKTEGIDRLPELEGFRRIVRAKSYATTVRCVEHRQAHNTLFRLVCWMRDLGLAPSEAYAVLLDWNATNNFREDGTTPYPWKTSELEHKIESSYGLRSRDRNHHRERNSGGSEEAR